jgi:16S rRNA (cytidine1402-2'-O)-methyltransferase
LPPKSAQRRKALAELAASPQTHVFYEAPHRLRESLQDVVDVLGPERPLVVARELTKLHEEFVRGLAADVLAELEKREIKGEITLLIGKAPEQAAVAAATRSASARLREIMQSEKLDEKAALKILAKELGVSKSEAYRRVQASR